ncbi:23-bisphosphoglycerate-independent phosphoglycerate mutase 1 isoform X1 [Iris pallida]|uniref:23-bisphosphoglycerate-independent phosphoglycerate mutase 1 isoform X1 n=1 Tax=Iris pallida TaxID=29817 RepID=A0AAX6FB86_IRIPA|nr:23-bisphosphoglycerate-independent phosphoglycerate mutase 1 isoform X1 [Iris pallida]KAJ6822687.1 23-bisphosphoglycerate-independent phosphoglycerate mutase 1 isoform X1 [Iris pallida]
MSSPKLKTLLIDEKARDAILIGKFEQVGENLLNVDMVGQTCDVEPTFIAYYKAADAAVKVIFVPRAFSVFNTSILILSCNFLGSSTLIQ